MDFIEFYRRVERPRLGPLCARWMTFRVIGVWVSGRGRAGIGCSVYQSLQPVRNQNDPAVGADRRRLRGPHGPHRRGQQGRLLFYQVFFMITI